MLAQLASDGTASERWLRQRAMASTAETHQPQVASLFEVHTAVGLVTTVKREAAMLLVIVLCVTRARARTPARRRGAGAHKLSKSKHQTFWQNVSLGVQTKLTSCFTLNALVNSYNSNTHTFNVKV